MKRNSQAGNKATGSTPAGSLAQPDERDQSSDGGDPPDRQTLGPRRIINQAAADIRNGQQDTDRHGIPNDVPNPGGRTGAAGGQAPVEGGGNRRSYAADQGNGKPPH